MILKGSGMNDVADAGVDMVMTGEGGVSVRGR